MLDTVEIVAWLGGAVKTSEPLYATNRVAIDRDRAKESLLMFIKASEL